MVAIEQILVLSKKMEVLQFLELSEGNFQESKRCDIDQDYVIFSQERKKKHTVSIFLYLYYKSVISLALNIYLLYMHRI